jgi:uncharacterized surface protein with fasciclin (FAS1) repeats
MHKHEEIPDMTTLNTLTKHCKWLSLITLFALGSNVALAAGPKGPTIVDVAIAVNSEGQFAGTFDILIAAVLAADPAVVETLDGRGQHTVFAPTDAAFENALMATEEEILKLIEDGDLDADTLTPILLYHVAKGRRDSEDVTTSTQIHMLNRGFVQVSGINLTDNQGNVSTIIVPDVPAANGIIHAIDGVLLP